MQLIIAVLYNDDVLPIQWLSYVKDLSYFKILYIYLNVFTIKPLKWSAMF